MRSDWTAAEQNFLAAMQVWNECGDRHNQGITLHQLARLALARSDHEAATDHLFSALAIWAEFDDSHRFQLSLRAVAQVWGLRSDALIAARLATLLGIDRSRAVAILQQVLADGSPSASGAQARES
jgi:hypothetical protein